MTTTLNPPPQTPAGPPPAGAPRPPASGAARVIAIIAIVFGVFVIVGTVAKVAVSTAVSASVHTTTRTAEAAGAESLRVDASAGTLRIEFADVRDVELEVTGSTGGDRWRLDRDGDEIVVDSPQGFDGWWFFGNWFGGPDDAVLRLPQSLEGLDADLTFSAGALSADGDFGDLAIEMNAGQADISGSAETVTTDMNAGRADLELADVRSAELSVNAGSVDARLTGSQPDDVTVDVSAGSLNLTLPDGEYDVTSEVSAGGFDNRIGSVPSASSTVRVTVSAGQVVLRAR